MLKSKLNLFTAADMVLVLIIISGVVLSYLYLHNNKSDGTAYIYYRNTLLGVYSLSENQTIQINDECIAEIKAGKIKMLDSDCPDKRCIKQGWSDLVPIICLPNQIVIEIRHNKEQKVHILH